MAKIITVAVQTNPNKIFETVAKQQFQKFYWFRFERKALNDWGTILYYSLPTIELDAKNQELALRREAPQR